MPSRPPDFSAALSKFEASTRSKLSAVMLSSTFKGVITAAEAQQLAQQLGITVPQLMLELLPFAQMYAQPAISAFKVGAIAMGLTGNLYYGGNMEFLGEALIYTVHAEQAATVNAWMNGETGITTLAVSAAPCGYCRQFLYELVTASQLQVYLPNQAPQSLNYYLPNAFGPGDLGLQGGLLSTQNNNLVLDEPPISYLVTQALAAANMSYAPYTSLVSPNQGKACYAGVALMNADENVFTGAYAENAAYNPTMLPMEAALVMMNMAGGYGIPITQAVLVQGHVVGQQGSTNPLCDQQAVSLAVLQTLSNAPLQVAFAHQ